MKADYSGCKEGKHKLVRILEKDNDQELAVVKWCKECGAIVVDGECDNRTNAGYFMKMKFPNIAEDHVDEIMS